MILTEEEAKNKWCPFVCHPQFGNTQDLKGTRCIASECMAWRRFPDYRPNTSEAIEKGYCGLAGAP